MNPTNLIALFASLGVGCGVLYANPKRPINRAFFVISVLVAAWLMSLEWLNNPINPNPVHWLRVVSAIGAFIPFLLWVIKDCAKGAEFGWSSVRNGWAWLAAGTIMAAVCFTPYFIPIESTQQHPIRGIGWSAYVVVLACSYLVLLGQGLLSLRAMEGIQKIELQTLLLGGTAAGLVGIALSALGPILGNHTLPHQIPIVIFAFYTFTAWAITTQKIFDARQLFRSGFQLFVSVGIVTALVGAAMAVSPELAPRPMVAVLCAVLITLLFKRFNRQVQRATQLGSDREADVIRSTIVAASRDEFDHDALVRRFSTILETWGRSERACFLSWEKDVYSYGRYNLPAASDAATELLRAKWATPESLQRQREAPGRRELLSFMKENRLGVMIAAPSHDGLAAFIIVLESRRDRIPFTWTEVKLLQEWTAVIENTLSRINLSKQARESEQLRTAGLLGASLAHEIRNPLVTLKTIAQSAKTRYNDPEFRRLLIELVPAEIERIEGLVSGLMDLGRPQHPHFESLRLNEVVETSVKLVRPKALDEAVDLTCALEADPDEVNADRAFMRQIILNLVMNAIQAVATIDGKRSVMVRTRLGVGSVVLEVADNGPGMPQEVRERLFQPFTTSNKTSGIGLGLAITADLVKLHHGLIALVGDNEMGTTFRVTLPCQQPSS
jgi:signal transduction histidine kinase